MKVRTSFHAGTYFDPIPGRLATSPWSRGYVPGPQQAIDRTDEDYYVHDRERATGRPMRWWAYLLLCGLVAVVVVWAGVVGAR